MNKQQAQLDALHDIRNMMERSTRFMSLSGIAGISAGIWTLLGLSVAQLKYEVFSTTTNFLELTSTNDGALINDFITFMAIDALLVFVLAALSTLFWSARKAKKQNQSLWSSSSRRLWLSLLIPIATAILFCLALWMQGQIALIAPVSLLFYGFGLLQASQHSLPELRQLGWLQIALGLAAGFFPLYSLWFWGFGFGMLHLVYGLAMYLKYDR